MTWNPAAAGALDLAHLRTASSLLPRSSSAFIHGLLAAVELRPRDSATLNGMEVLKHMYIAALRAHAGEGVLWDIIRVGYYLNHPRRILDPEKFVAQGEYVPLPSERELLNVVAAGERLSCPLNTRGTSCFTDTPLVIMFIATDAYDTAVRAIPLPDKYRPSEEEMRLMHASDDIVDWCSGRFDLPKPADPVSAQDVLRQIAWGLRTPRGSGGRAIVEDLVSQLRDEIGRCIPFLDVATGQEDMGVMYESLMAMNGWLRWFVTPEVSIGTMTAVDGTRLQTPILTQIDVDIGPTALRVKLKVPAGRQLSTSESLQDLIDASVLSESIEDTSVFATDFGDMDKLVALGGEVARRAGTKRLEAMPYMQERAQEEMALLLEIESVGFSGVDIPILMSTDEVEDLVAESATIREIEKNFRDVYNETIKSVREYANKLSAAGVFSKVGTPGEQRYRKAVVKTGANMPRLVSEITTTRYLADEAQSGVAVFDSAGLSKKWGNAPVSTHVRLPPNRIIDLPVGRPGRRRTEQYRVFAVAIRDAAGSASGHYWAYFWRGESMFVYNDLPPVGSPILEQVRDVGRAFDTIAAEGYFFFAHKVTQDVPPPGSPPVIPVAPPPD